MLTIIWRPRAERRLEQIIAYVAQRNYLAAQRLKNRIQESVIPIAEHPYLFRMGRVPTTRELVAHPNYIVVYRVLADRVEVINVLHSAMQYP